MTELSGTLDGIGLAPLVGFLTDLSKTGRLAVSDGPTNGTVYLESGRVVGAVFGAERGVAALDAIGLALGSGRFGFVDDTGEPDRNLALEPAELKRHLDQLTRERATLAAAVPSLTAVPRAVVDDSSEQDELALDRDTLRLLLALDGRQTVTQLAQERGLMRTLKQLAKLVELGLARLDVPTAVGATVVEDATRVAAPAEAVDAGQDANARSSVRPGSTWSRWHRTEGT